MPGDSAGHEISVTKDLLDQSLSIRNYAVNRKHVSSREMTNLLIIVRSLLVAFDDIQGTRMAHGYIALSAEATAAKIQNHQEFDIQRVAAERESKDALKNTEVLIKARLQDKLRPQVQRMSSIIAAIEGDAGSEPTTSPSAKKTTWKNTNIYRAVSVVRQRGKLHLRRTTIVIFSISVVTICGMLYSFVY